nr:DEAD/DEAH box helicase [Falsiroseomonas frigidaquae]
MSDHSDATAPRAAETEHTAAAPAEAGTPATETSAVPKAAESEAEESGAAEAAPAPRKRRAPSAKTLAARAAKAEAAAAKAREAEVPGLLAEAHEPVAEMPPAEPAAAEPVAPEPVAAEPAAQESAAPEPVVQEPVAAEPAAPEPVAPEPVAPEPAAEAAPAAEVAVVPEAQAEPADETPVLTEAETEAAQEAREEAASWAAEEPPRTTFADLGLSEPILRAVADTGYLHPTPIQEQAIPIVLMGRDVLGCAQTGTGKTAGFTLPMLDILAGSRAKARMPRSLILEPTRELALQVAENFVKYGKHLNLTHALLIGGESMNDQRDVLEKGVDVLIATPGRLLDLFDRGRILLADCKVLVIDEADRMLDMGFIPDVERIVSMLPRMRQTLFFSATMAPEIRRLADAFLQNPREITVSAPATVATTITTGLVWVREHEKREALRKLLNKEAVQNALVFCNRKVEVDVLYKSLKKHGFSVGALHGDLEQSVRFATLNRFKANEIQILVCSDVAARGLDIGGLSHVFNFDVPFHAEDYVHRIGRTGRAGRQGHAYSLAAPEDAKSVAAIERLTGMPIPRMEIEGLEPVTAEEIEEGAKARRGRGGRAAPAGREAGGRESGGRDVGKGRDGGRGRDRGREPRRDAPPPARAEEAVRAERPPREDRGPRRDARPPRDEARPPREDVRPVRDEARPPRDEARPPRDDRGPRRDTKREEPQSLEARREEFRRERREDREAGPSPRGFGDAVPAFMLLSVPKPRRDTSSDAEAA